MFRTVLADPDFLIRHKRQSEDFTRVRVFTFPLLLGIMLRKSSKSIQLLLNEIVALLPGTTPSVTGAAYTKARQKIRHTAFIELNERVVVNLTYTGQYQTYRGHRLLAVDGSKILLPNTSENQTTFGTIAYTNQDTQIHGEHAWARASVLYDVLNGVAVDAILARVATSEIDLAQQHLAQSIPNDLILFDRGYCSYPLMAAIKASGAQFLIRCHRRSFQTARTMFTNRGPDSITVTIPAPKNVPRSRLATREVPATMAVRFVRVVLSTGETEVLVTSLLDEVTYPTASFQKLYWQRWGIETFYGIIKTRLSLENFSGYSAESVRQDFFATVFLSGLESIMTEDVDETLRHKVARHAQRVNKAVSFHALKHRAFDIMLSDQPPETIVEELTHLFLTNPTLYRPHKNPERKQRSSHQVLQFFKRKRKVVF
jgi:ribonuclease HII